MTSQLKAKLLQHFAGKKANGGFTLIELLVVIIIIGILSAIALPSFLNQANKAKQSEAKTYVGSMNRAQQAYYLENGSMATNARFAQLGLGVKPKTDNYRYHILDTAAADVTPQGKNPYAGALASPLDPALKLYAGGVKIATIGSGTTGVESTTLATLCEALLPSAAPEGNGGYTGLTNDAGTTFSGGETFNSYLINVDVTPTTTPGCAANMKEL